MSVIEDMRKVVQDLVASELKSLSVKLDNFERESKLRGENLLAMIENGGRESKLRDESLAARIESSEKETKLRDENLAAKIDSGERLTHAKLEAFSAKSLLYSLNLDKRVEVPERDKQASA